MSFGDSILRSAALWLLLGGCARPTEVELRLYPCGFAGALPVSVDLEVRGYDAMGTALKPLTASYMVAAGVLADGYATVGLRPPEGIATADFIVTWHDAVGGAQVVMHAALAVPTVGEVLELGADMCAPVDSTSSGVVTTSTGEGTSTSTGVVVTTSGTDSGTSSTSTGDSTSTSASTSTGDSTGTSTTGEMSMVGDPCNMANDQFFCEGGGPGQLGTLLECTNSIWTAANLKSRCSLPVYCPPETGLVDPVAVGCSGQGAFDWACVCQDQVPLECLGDEASCLGNDRITLCIDDGQGKKIRTKGVCAVFCVDADIAGPWCTGA